MSEQHTHSKIISAMASGSLAIFASRVTGLIRDILFAKYWGTGNALGGFFVAFTIPNLFRRILGEGALTESFIPLFTEKLTQGGKKKAFLFASNVLTVVSLVLVLIVILGIGLCEIGSRVLPGVFASQTITFVKYLLPYTYFICIVGILSGILNTFNQFALPALNPIVLNFCIIMGLLYSHSNLELSNPENMHTLIFVVLVAGVLQLLLLIPCLMKIDFFFQFIPNCKSPEIRELGTLLVPGIFGASVNQINVLMDRLFAGWLGGYAVTSLYYSERIVYLPIGIFAVALSTACLPSFSKSVIEGDTSKMAASLWYALRHVLYLTVPCVLLLFMLPLELVRLLYQWGNFDLESTQNTISALLFYAPGIPVFAAAKILRAGFYSRKDMKTPVRIALICLVLNIILNLILIIPLKHCGLALATTLSAYMNVILLAIGIFQFLPSSCIPMRELSLTALRLASGVTGAILTINLVGKVWIFAEESILSRLYAFFIPSILGLLSYLLISVFLGSKEPHELYLAFSSKLRRTSH